MEQLSILPPLTENEADDLKKKEEAFREYEKQKRKFENAFQKWSDETGLEGNTPLGVCGYGGICDYCSDNSYGRPCVRALNAKAREKHIKIDYSDTDFEKWFDL